MQMAGKFGHCLLVSRCRNDERLGVPAQLFARGGRTQAWAVFDPVPRDPGSAGARQDREALRKQILWER
jgi:hypothetical protein